MYISTAALYRRQYYSKPLYSIVHRVWELTRNSRTKATVVERIILLSSSLYHVCGKMSEVPIRTWKDLLFPNGKKYSDFSATGQQYGRTHYQHLGIQSCRVGA